MRLTDQSELSMRQARTRCRLSGTISREFPRKQQISGNLGIGGLILTLTPDHGPGLAFTSLRRAENNVLTILQETPREPRVWHVTNILKQPCCRRPHGSHVSGRGVEPQDHPNLWFKESSFNKVSLKYLETLLFLPGKNLIWVLVNIIKSL